MFAFTKLALRQGSVDIDSRKKPPEVESVTLHGNCLIHEDWGTFQLSFDDNKLDFANHHQFQRSTNERYDSCPWRLR
jgi:hypothetical protein